MILLSLFLMFAMNNTSEHETKIYTIEAEVSEIKLSILEIIEILKIESSPPSRLSVLESNSHQLAFQIKRLGAQIETLR